MKKILVLAALFSASVLVAGNEVNSNQTAAQKEEAKVAIIKANEAKNDTKPAEKKDECPGNTPVHAKVDAAKK